MFSWGLSAIPVWGPLHLVAHPGAAETPAPIALTRVAVFKTWKSLLYTFCSGRTSMCVGFFNCSRVCQTKDHNDSEKYDTAFSGHG